MNKTIRNKAQEILKRIDNWPDLNTTDPTCLFFLCRNILTILSEQLDDAIEPKTMDEEVLEKAREIYDKIGVARMGNSSIIEMHDNYELTVLQLKQRSNDYLTQYEGEKDRADKVEKVIDDFVEWISMLEDVNEFATSSEIKDKILELCEGAK